MNSFHKSQSGFVRWAWAAVLVVTVSACGTTPAAPDVTSSPPASTPTSMAVAAATAETAATTLAMTATPLPTATPVGQLTASPSLAPSQVTFPSMPATPTLARGYLTTPAELRRVARLARSGQEPYQAAVENLLTYAAQTLKDKKMRAPQKINVGGDIEKPEILALGSKYAYAWALAYNLLLETDPETAEKYASRAHDLVMQMPKRGTRVNDYENNTRLNLSVYIENFVYAADLLADWHIPDEATPFADSEDAKLLKTWLGEEIIRYPYNAALTRVNNWGSWGRLSTAVVADYVGDDAPLFVQAFVKDANGAYQVDPAVPCEPGETKSCQQVDGGTMYQQALSLHLDVVDGNLAEFSTSSCDSSGSKSMIRPDGGLPDELRREYTCDVQQIADAYGPAARYSQFAVEAMISLAELAWRRGDPSLYTHIDAVTERGSLYRAIQFLIDNKVRLTRGSMLEMANRFYTYQQSIEQDTTKRSEYTRLLDEDLPGILKAENDWPAGAGFVSFGTLTHGFALGEQLAPPPIVPPRTPNS